VAGASVVGAFLVGAFLVGAFILRLVRLSSGRSTLHAEARTSVIEGQTQFIAHKHSIMRNYELADGDEHDFVVGSNSGLVLQLCRTHLESFADTSPTQGTVACQEVGAFTSDKVINRRPAGLI